MMNREFLPQKLKVRKLPREIWSPAYSVIPLIIHPHHDDNEVPDGGDDADHPNRSAEEHIGHQVIAGGELVGRGCARLHRHHVPHHTAETELVRVP